LAVVAVHGVRLSLQSAFPAAGGLLQMVLQFGRLSFMFMTGFVLTYQYGAANPPWINFFKRRYKSVLFPYLVWLLVFVALDTGLTPVSRLLDAYLSALPNGSGHLYYLLITMQLYVLTPVMLWLARRTERHPWWVFGAAVLWQLGGWSYAMYVDPSTPIAYTLYVWSYAGFIVVGSLTGYHWPRIRAWLDARRPVPVYVYGAAFLVMAGVYWITYDTGGVGAATNVFQPTSVVYGLAVLLLLTGLGVWYERIRAQRPGLTHVIFLFSEYSFAIYLVHPLFVHLWLWTSARFLSVEPWINMVIAVAVGWGMSLLLALGLRKLPGAVFLIGMPRQGPAATPWKVARPRPSRS
jgi:peptidoglycan/LPS O-acetylase OafA/YrhL